MKSKILSIACLALLMMACEPNTPDDPPVYPTQQDSVTHAQDSALKAQLIGVWNVTYSPKKVRSLMFTEHGVLIYRSNLNTNLQDVSNYKQYRYSIENGKLVIDEKDTTLLDLQDSILKIPYFSNLQLKRAVKKAPIPLSESSKAKLDSVYSSKNPALYTGAEGNLVPLPYNSLKYLDSNTRIPEFNNQKHTLILGMVARYSREGMNVDLYYNPEEDYYEFAGEARIAEEGETLAYPYGIYEVPYSNFLVSGMTLYWQYNIVRMVEVFPY